MKYTIILAFLIMGSCLPSRREIRADNKLYAESYEQYSKIMIHAEELRDKGVEMKKEGWTHAGNHYLDSAIIILQTVFPYAITVDSLHDKYKKLNSKRLQSKLKRMGYKFEDND